MLLMASANAQEWVVKEFLGEPQAFQGQAYYRPAWGSPLGDLNDDGLLDLQWVEQWHDQSGRLMEEYSIVSGNSRKHPIALHYLNGPGKPVLWRQGSCLLRWPADDVLAVVDNAAGTSTVRLFSISLHSPIGSIPLPPSAGTGFPAPHQFDAVIPAGDLDGDSYDDLLCQLQAFDPGTNKEYAVLGLVSGFSRVFSWLAYLPAIQRPYSFHAGFFPDLWPDLNGDGVRDFLFLSGDLADSELSAVSGMDGRLIWSLPGLGPRLDDWTQVEDMTGDGVRDVLVAASIDWLNTLPSQRDPGYVALVDGASGVLVWINRYGNLLPWLHDPLDQRMVVSTMLAGSADHDADGSRDIVLTMGEFLSWTHLPYYAIWVFSGADGSFVRRETTAQSVDPWESAPLQGNGFYTDGPLFAFQDLDRNGWPEMSVVLDINPAYPGSRASVFLERRSLDLEGTNPIGQIVPYRLHLPGASNLNYQLLISQGFDAQGGSLHLGPWDTKLVRDAIMTAAFGSPWLSGTLDFAGRAAGAFFIPADPALIGQTFYARAIVEDAGSPGGVWTMSSLAWTRVTP